MSKDQDCTATALTSAHATISFNQEGKTLAEVLYSQTINLILCQHYTETEIHFLKRLRLLDPSMGHIRKNHLQRNYESMDWKPRIRQNCMGQEISNLSILQALTCHERNKDCQPHMPKKESMTQKFFFGIDEAREERPSNHTIGLIQVFDNLTARESVKACSRFS